MHITSTRMYHDFMAIVSDFLLATLHCIRVCCGFCHAVSMLVQFWRGPRLRTRHVKQPVHQRPFVHASNKQQAVAPIHVLQVGWPTMLPSKERRQFAGKIHDLKKKHLNNMVMDGKLPLRPGEFFSQSRAFKPCHRPTVQGPMQQYHVTGCYCSAGIMGFTDTYSASRNV